MSVFIAEFASPKGYATTFCGFDILFHEVTVNQKGRYFQRAALENLSVILFLGITCEYSGPFPHRHSGRTGQRFCAQFLEVNHRTWPRHRQIITHSNHFI